MRLGCVNNDIHKVFLNIKKKNELVGLILCLKSFTLT